MATVVSITNPITGAVEQVDKLDHTAQQIDDAVALAPQLSNPNILDNWYFGNPVNQRGQTSWANPSDWQYTIDRWKITPSSVIALADGGITITADFQQGLEKDRLEFGRTYTFSVLSSDGRLGKHTFVLTSDMNINVGFGFGYFVCYLSGDSVWFRIYGDGSTYKAAKLELCSQQTLAHQDADGNWVLNEIPDYGEQLRRCQRYQLVINSNSTTNCYIGTGVANSSTTARVFVPTPVSLRTKPVITVTGVWALSNGLGGYTVGTIAVGDLAINGVHLVLSGTSGLTAGQSVMLRGNELDAKIILDANL